MWKAIAATLAVVTAALVVAPSVGTPREVTRPLMDNGAAYCSGVMIAPHRMLTAAHCVNDKLTVVSKNAEADVALIEVNEDCPCTVLAQSPAVIDEPLTVVGYPKNDFIRVQILTEGRAQGEAGEKEKRRLRMTAPIASGNSGGGVFLYRNGRWELVGLEVAVYSECEAVGMMRQVCVPFAHLSFATTFDSVKKITGQ